MERILLEDMGCSVAQGAEENGTVEGGGDRRGVTSLWDVASATYFGEGARPQKVQHAEGSGTLPVPPVSWSHALVGAAPHALGKRVLGPTKDEAMVWETQIMTLSAEFHDVAVVATGPAVEQDSTSAGGTSVKRTGGG